MLNSQISKSSNWSYRFESAAWILENYQNITDACLTILVVGSCGVQVKQMSHRWCGKCDLHDVFVCVISSLTRVQKFFRKYRLSITLLIPPYSSTDRRCLSSSITSPGSFRNCNYWRISSAALAVSHGGEMLVAIIDTTSFMLWNKQTLISALAETRLDRQRLVIGLTLRSRPSFAFSSLPVTAS